jgi:hypothetical protein
LILVGKIEIHWQNVVCLLSDFKNGVLTVVATFSLLSATLRDIQEATLHGMSSRFFFMKAI